MKLLIVDHARDVAAGIAFGARITWPGCLVTIAADGAEALRRFAQDGADLVVLDVALPPPDGFEVCRAIRRTSAVPILMLAACDGATDKVRAFDLGADDYVTKPFEPLELLARLRALMRRVDGPYGARTTTRVCGDITLDPATREVRQRGELLYLTCAEYRLLEALLRQAGTVLSHRFLLQHVWGQEDVGDIQALKVFIRRLRRKLGDDPCHPRYIQTEWGVGYRFVAPC